MERAFFCILLYQENGRSILIDLLDDIKNLIYINWRKSHRRLVQNDQPGVAHKSAAHGKHLLLAAGKSACQLVFPLLQTGKALIDHL